MPSQAGVVSADVDALAEYIADPAAAEPAGKAAREFALAHFGLERFLRDWDRFIEARCA